MDYIFIAKVDLIRDAKRCKRSINRRKHLISRVLFNPVNECACEILCYDEEKCNNECARDKITLNETTLQEDIITSLRIILKNGRLARRLGNLGRVNGNSNITF